MDHPTENTVRNLHSDLISNLPINIVETILMCLPLREAVRTSTLSKQWRYYWVKIPKLVLDRTLLPQTLALRYNWSDKYKYMLAICNILSRHHGPILQFTLSFSGVELFFGFDLFIYLVSRKGVQVFTLHSGGDRHYKLPPSFFSCAQLRRLDLAHCEFKPPLGFNGFSRLENLNFNYVQLDANFSTFVSNCPLLQSLILGIHTDSYDLEFDAPLLKYLRIDSRFSSICFKNTPLLEYLCITSNGDDRLEQGNPLKMTKVFEGLRGIKALQSNYRFLKFLTFGGVPMELPFFLNQLTILQLHKICFGEMNMVSVVLCLIKSSPNLEKVIVEVLTRENDHAKIKLAVEFMESQHYLPCMSLNRLREVHVSSMIGAEQEIQFIKLMLAKSPLLEKMIIEPCPGFTSDDRVKTMKVLKKIKWKSTEAQVIFG